MEDLKEFIPIKKLFSLVRLYLYLQDKNEESSFMTLDFWCEFFPMYSGDDDSYHFFEHVLEDWYTKFKVEIHILERIKYFENEQTLRTESLKEYREFKEFLLNKIKSKEELKQNLLEQYNKLYQNDEEFSLSKLWFKIKPNENSFKLLKEYLYDYAKKYVEDKLISELGTPVFSFDKQIQILINNIRKKLTDGFLSNNLKISLAELLKKSDFKPEAEDFLSLTPLGYPVKFLESLLALEFAEVVSIKSIEYSYFKFKVDDIDRPFFINAYVNVDKNLINVVSPEYVKNKFGITIIPITRPSEREFFYEEGKLYIKKQDMNYEILDLSNCPTLRPVFETFFFLYKDGREKKFKKDVILKKYKEILRKSGEKITEDIEGENLWNALIQRKATIVAKKINVKPVLKERIVWRYEKGGEYEFEILSLQNNNLS